MPRKLPDCQIRVLFVCMGNICRSPSAEGVFRRRVETHALHPWIEIASAGTHNYHVGHPADPRSATAAKKRGIDLSAHKAQHLAPVHFECFDYILVMDERNYQDVIAECPRKYREKVRYLLEFAPELETREVPDPYYGGPHGFEHVLDLIEAASDGLIRHIQNRFPMQAP